MLSWDDEATDEQEAIDVTFEITAVDRWGQRSESSDSVHVTHPGSEGPVCSIVGRRGDATWMLFLLAAGGLLAARRRRSGGQS